MNYYTLENAKEKALEFVKIKFPDNKLTIGDNNLILGVWVDTNPHRSFVPLIAPDGDHIRVNFTKLEV